MLRQGGPDRQTTRRRSVAILMLLAILGGLGLSFRPAGTASDENVGPPSPRARIASQPVRSAPADDGPLPPAREPIRVVGQVDHAIAEGDEEEPVALDEHPVSCALDSAQVPEGDATLFEPTDFEFGGWKSSRMIKPTFDAQGMHFRTRSRTGAAKLRLDGFVSPVEVRWSEAPSGDLRCEPVKLAKAATVVGRVQRTDGPRVFVSGCGGKTGTVNTDGSFYMEVEPGRSCEVRAAWVLDAGGTLLEGPPVVVEPTLDQDTVVDLELPEPP